MKDITLFGRKLSRDPVNKILNNYLGVLDINALRLVNSESRYAVDNEDVWSVKLQRHFPHIWQRVNAASQRNFKESFKKSFKREYVALNPRQKMLFTHVKEGDLIALQQLNPTFEELLLSDSNGTWLATWAYKLGQQAVLDYFYRHAQQAKQTSRGKLLNLIEVYSETQHANQTPLLRAILCNQPAVVRELVSTNADNTLAMAGLHEQPALHVVMRLQNLPMLDLLIDLDLAVNAVDKSGMNPLHLAALNNFDVATMRRLLDLAAQKNTPFNIDATTQFGYTPLLYAAKEGNSHMVDCLADLGANLETAVFNQTAQMLAAKAGHAGVVGVLANHGANLEAKDANDRTSLHLAVEHGHNDVVKMLIQLKANLEATCTVGSIRRYTPLMIAARDNQLEMAQALINAGAQLETTNSSGQTALMIAEEHSHSDVISALAAVGANSEAEFQYGDSGRHMAL